MSRMTKDLLLVGSVPLGSTEEVLRTCGELVGSYVPSLPDGERDDRSYWIDWLALHVYHHHPDIETLVQPSTGHYSTSLTDFWQFRLLPHVTELRFDAMGYVEEAITSYEIFTRVRDSGVIPSNVRFQVCIPMIVSGTHMFFRNTADWPVIETAYAEGIRRDITKMLDHIPSTDLAIQWDMPVEVLTLTDTGLPWDSETYNERYQRCVNQLAHVSYEIPDEVLLGYHICYGALGGWPMIPFEDLSLCVRLANAAVARAGRRVDYVHMPVKRHTNSAFFRPVQDLNIGDARVYLGLIHHTDGVSGFKERVAHAREHLSDFGIASVCGYGRMDPAEVPHALEVHRDCAAAL